MRRGQISLFLIVAAVLVIVIVLAIRLAAQLAPDTAGSTFPVNAQDANTTLCLRDATTAAILQAMREGGVNADYIVPDPSDPAYLTTPAIGRIRIGIKRATNSQFPVYAPAPTPPFIPDVSSPQFGRVTFEPLCARRGANMPNIDLTGANTCLRGTYHVANPIVLSFQERLEQRITAAITEIDATTGNTVTKPGCPELTSPVIVTLGGSDVTTTVGNESVQVPIRLKAMYNAAWTFARLEASDPNFKLTPTGVPFSPSLPCEDTDNGNQCMRQGFTFTTQQLADPCEWNEPNPPDICTNSPPNWKLTTTIVSLTDTTVRIDGEHPVFRFAIRNRYPLIDYRYDPASLVPPPAPSAMCDLDKYDLGIDEQISLSVLLGVDTDDAPLLALINSADSAVTASITPTTPMLCTNGACSLTLSCKQWIDNGASSPATLQTVFCSQPETLGAVQLTWLQNLLSLPGPDDCHVLSIPLTVTLYDPTPVCTPNDTTVGCLCGGTDPLNAGYQCCGSSGPQQVSGTCPP